MPQRLTRLIIVSGVGSLPAVILTLAWVMFARSSSRRAFLFGSPFAVWDVARTDLVTGSFLLHIAVTFSETALGLLVGSFIGVIVGYVLWVERRIGQMAMPYIVFVGAIPIFALAPMMIIWFGTGMLAKIVMASSTVLVVSLVSSFNTANRLMLSHEDWLHGLNASRSFALTKVIFPEALRSVFEVARLNVGFAILGAFIAEFVSSDRGLGFYILRASGLYDTPRVIFGVLMLGVLALSLTGLVYLLEMLVPALRYSKHRNGV